MSGRLLAVLFAVATLLLAWNFGSDIFSGATFYYNEGPLLDQAMRLLHGEPIYRADFSQPPYTVSNYGPIFHLLQLPFLAVFGPTFIPGRIISVAAHLFSTLFAGLIFHHLTGDKRKAAVVSLLVFVAPMVGGGMPLYRVDPLAQAFSLAGLYVVMSGRRIIWAALLFAAAIYSKQSYALVGPGAAFFYLFLQGHQLRAVSFAATLMAIAGSLFLIGQWLTDGGLYINLVTANVNLYLIINATRPIIELVQVSFFGFVSLFYLFKMPRSNTRLFVLLYLAGSLIVAAAIGKAGSNLGYFSELQVALAFVMGMVALPPNVLKKRADGVPLLLLGQMALYFYFLVMSPYHGFIHVHKQYSVELQRIIAETKGPILADRYMGLLVLAGKPIYFQPFEMSQLWLFGHWSPDHFLDELRQRKFDLILVENNSWQFERWTPEMFKAMEKHYRSRTIDDTIVFQKQP